MKHTTLISRSGRASATTAVGPVFRSNARGESAFTMVEIALSLAVIGFGLMGVIAILPLGMNTQKENREETIINQDATYWLEAIRGGARGLDDLTNYVGAINISTTVFNAANMSVILQETHSYTNPAYPLEFSVPNPHPFALTNGLRIVGLLSTPKYSLRASPTRPELRSNYVVAYINAISGSAVEKYPQNNPAIRGTAFKYRLTSEVIPYSCFDTNAATYDTNYWRLSRNLATNLHELRLTFHWPLLPNGKVGRGGPQSFRTMVGGWLTNVSPLNPSQAPLYFVESKSYLPAR
jgi:type II secretory pathway pseudopilin PulG